MKRFLAYMSFQELERHQLALQRVYILFGEQWVKSESGTHPTGLVVPASGYESVQAVENPGIQGTCSTKQRYTIHTRKSVVEAFPLPTYRDAPTLGLISFHSVGRWN